MNKVNKLGSTARFVWLGIWLSFLTGCASTVAIESDDFGVREHTIETSLDEYQLQVGDRISLVCVVKEGTVESLPYYLNVGDVIALNIQDREDLSYQYSVNPDGTVQFMLLGSFQVLGMTLDELSSELQKRYLEAGVLDKLSLGLVKYNIAVERFISKLNPGGLGNEPYSSTISVDGTANFPLIGFVHLNGMTLQKADQLIEEKYQALFNNIDITLRIEKSDGHSITVLGEVVKPGTIQVNGTVSVLAALGSVGGYTNGAQLDSIMIVQKRGLNVYVNKYNLDSDLFAMANHKMIAGDFIFVPKSRITNVNVFVDQYLRRNLPFGASVTYNVR